MPLTFIIWFMLLISGHVQQQQPHVELQLPVDYHGHPHRAGLDGQVSTSYPVTANNITLSPSLDTSVSDQNSSSAGSFRATSAELGINHGNSTATAKRLSSTDDYDGALSTNLWTRTETDISKSSRSTSSTGRGTNRSSSPSASTLRASIDEGVGASTANRLTTTETGINTTYWSTASAELRTNSATSTATATLRSSTDDYAASSTTSRLTTSGADIGTSSCSTASGTEFGTTNGSSSATTTMLSSPDHDSEAWDADGVTNVQGGKKPVDWSQPWKMASRLIQLIGVLVLIVTLLGVMLVILVVCVRRCISSRNTLTSLPGDIEMTFVTPSRPFSTETGQQSAPSASPTSDVCPSSEIIVL